MLTISIQGPELFDEKTEEFTQEVLYSLELEHSLVSLSKWESKFEKPFLGKEEKSTEEVLGYIRYMIVTPNPPESFISDLSEENLAEITEYINAKQSATFFNDQKEGPPSREVYTSELLYYWMISRGIPMQCETWHLNRLLTLIRVFDLKSAEQNGKKTKRVSRDGLAARRALNQQRKAQLGTNG